MEETKKQRRARKAKEYADNVADRKARKARMTALKEEMDEIRDVDRVSDKSDEVKKAYPIRMTMEVRDDFADIASEQGITQQVLIEHFVMLYSVDKKDRLKIWDQLFKTKEEVVTIEDATIEELEKTLALKKLEIETRRARKGDIKSQGLRDFLDGD